MTLRRLVGLDRGTAAVDAKIADAERLLGERRADLARVQAEHDLARERVTSAEQTFDADPSDANADALLGARRALERTSLFVGREQRRVAEAEAAVGKLQTEWRNAELDGMLRALTVDHTTADRARLVALEAEASAIVERIRTAAQEAGELRKRAIATSTELGRRDEIPSVMPIANLHLGVQAEIATNVRREQRPSDGYRWIEPRFAQHAMSLTPKDAA